MTTVNDKLDSYRNVTTAKITDTRKHKEGSLSINSYRQKEQKTVTQFKVGPRCQSIRRKKTLQKTKDNITG